MTVVSEFARFVAGLRWQNVPDPIARKLEDHILDTLGVMCAGVSHPSSAQARRAFEHWTGSPECTIVGTSKRLPPPQAAFLNAFHGRIHTFDDTIDAGPVHPGSVVIAGALASAEAGRASGATFLMGVLAGYEIVARIVAAFGSSHYALGFHTTGTCNVFGVAAAAACIRGLDEKGIANALGIAGGMASGLRQYQIDGSMSASALNGGHAALAGVLAAEFAACGLAGAEGIIDGKFGLGSIAARDADFARATDALGTNYQFAATAIKPYPTCRFTHGPLHVLAELKREHNLTSRDIEGIEIETFRQSIEVSDKPHVQSRTDALLSHQVSAALLLERGAIDIPALDGAAYRDPAVLNLAARIRVRHAPDLEAMYPAAWPHRVIASTSTGQRLERLSLHPPGGQGDPLPRPIVEAKFRTNAMPVLGEQGTELTAMRVQSLQNEVDVWRLASGPPVAASVARAVDRAALEEFGG